MDPPQDHRNGAESTRFVTECLARLRDLHGEVGTKDPIDPLDELILTILSQNTNDNNRDRAYRSLRERFPENSDLLDADIDDIEDAIRVGGLAASKSGNIKRILEDLIRERGTISLEYLRDMDDRSAMEELISMKGVGSKTAACVLVFSLGRDVFPVDTHINRIVKRWGVVPPNTNREKTQEIMNTVVPDGWKYQGHLLIIRHGRTVCKARSPRCGECPLNGICPRIGVI